MNATQFRRIALAMEGAVEGAHMGHPDFRANGRIFATLHADERTGMVKLSPGQQGTFMETAPDTFTPAAGAWGRQGCTIVRLASADEETLSEAMTLAWQATVKAREARRARGTRATGSARSRRPAPSRRRSSKR